MARFNLFFVFIYLASLFGAAANILVPADANAMGYGSTKSFMYFWSALYMCTFILLFRLKPIKFTNKELIVIFLAFYTVLSTLWSELPKQTFSYSVALTANFIFIFYMSRTFNLSEMLKLLMYVMNFLMLTGLIAGFSGYEGTIFYDPLQRSNFLGTALIKGFFSHKIYAGIYASLALILNLALLKGRLKFFWVAISLLSILVSGSATGLLIGVSLCTLFFYIKYLTLLNFSKSTVRLINILVFFTIIFIANALPIIFNLVGRESNLTGRTELWGWAIQFILEKPFFGWGYLGIFSDAFNAPSHVIDMGYYNAPHFHNVYLQALAELGLIGGGIFIYIYVVTLYRYFIQWLADSDIRYLVIFVCLFGTLISGFVVNVGLKYNDITLFLLGYFFLLSPKVKSEK